MGFITCGDAPKKKAKKKSTTKTVLKSAKSGKFVSKQQAECHPESTFKQTVTKCCRSK